jgi:hypothetical protein
VVVVVPGSLRLLIGKPDVIWEAWRLVIRWRVMSSLAANKCAIGDRTCQRTRITADCYST